MSADRALIFDIKRDCSEDGPGIRTTVFFKGCPLSCVWCQNPEGTAKAPELCFSVERCRPDICGRPCIDACPEACLEIRQDRLHIRRQDCTACSQCVEVCPAEALETSGFWIGLDDLLYRLLIDKPFYDSSAGGVTLSGGEVTQQMEFAQRLLRALRAEGVHTAIETSGFFNYRRFEESMLPWLDLVYFDLKLIDDNESRLYSGQGNRLILDNFVKLTKSSAVPVIARVPLIPGITTSEHNLRGIADFLARHGIDSATLMPYNPMWIDKAARLEKTPRYRCSRFMTAQEKSECAGLFRPGKVVEVGVD